MLIHIRYTDGRYDWVKPFRLSDMITAGRIRSFRRSDGWAVVGRDALRGSENRDYLGPDRRSGQTSGQGRVPGMPGRGYAPEKVSDGEKSKGR